jgi:hypothetical protein
MQPAAGGDAPARRWPPRFARVGYRSKSRRGGCKSWWLLMTGTVEKVDRKSRVRNNRIKEGRYLSQRCANGRFLKSKLRRTSLKIFFQHYRPVAVTGCALQQAATAGWNLGDQPCDLGFARVELAVDGVAIGPGMTAMTRTPRGRSSPERVRASETSPAFVSA